MMRRLGTRDLMFVSFDCAQDRPGQALRLGSGQGVRLSSGQTVRRILASGGAERSVLMDEDEGYLKRQDCLSCLVVTAISS
jgi:hypothetical protein